MFVYYSVTDADKGWAILDHCCTAEWTKGLSTTLSLDLSSLCTHSLHLFSAKSECATEIYNHKFGLN